MRAHCRSESEARALLAAIVARLKDRMLEMHPEKSSIVYCKDGSRKTTYPNVQFTFLGYDFRPRRTKTRHGKIWTGFLPAVSEAAKKRMRQQIRELKIPRQTSLNLNELAKRYNHHLRGWLNYAAVGSCDEIEPPQGKDKLPDTPVVRYGDRLERRFSSSR